MSRVSMQEVPWKDYERQGRREVSVTKSNITYKVDETRRGKEQSKSVVSVLLCQLERRKLRKRAKLREALHCRIFCDTELEGLEGSRESAEMEQ
ncbi:hypothetical protein ACH3XW_35015 [Acanthocheilonema viteae]